jgi:hypothetical protein
MAHPGFIVEFNNPSSYGQRFDAQLNNLQLKAKQLPHKTAWLLNYDGQFSRFRKLQREIATSIKVGGSALIVSRRTGKAWVMKKRPMGQFKLLAV